VSYLANSDGMQYDLPDPSIAARVWQSKVFQEVL